METEIWDVVKAHNSGGRPSMVLTLPHKLCEEYGISPGQEFIVKTNPNQKDRVVYERKGNSDET